MRFYRYMYPDDLQGLFGHGSGELVNRKPLESRIVQMSKGQQIQIGRKAASARLGKLFLKKLAGLGIK